MSIWNCDVLGGWQGGQRVLLGAQTHAGSSGLAQSITRSPAGKPPWDLRMNTLFLPLSHFPLFVRLLLKAEIPRIRKWLFFPFSPLLLFPTR